ncbi:hypothetical protein FWF48_04215, partial [Candidatus Saccharibacteria bacterium]|nr:hypothetical protein [Candidatus Saccharibacteria bacterium]
KNLKEVYNLFRAHKDLGVSVDIGINAPYTIASTGVTISTKVDGKDRFISDGKYTGTRKGVDNYTPQEDTVTAQDGTQQPIAPSAPSTGSTNLSELEQWSTNFQPASTCDDGTYVCDLQTYVGKFGMVLDFNFDKIYDGCYGSPSGDDQYVVAAYCHATPTKIFINDKYAGYPDDLKDIYIVDAVKHEMAHHLIGMICNTSSPAILGRMTEAATSSYAVLFLGASRERLSTGVPPEYQMSTKTDNLAHQIHDDKKCS